MPKKQLIIRDFADLYRNDPEKDFTQRFLHDISKIRDSIAGQDTSFDKLKFDEYFEAIFRNLNEALLAKDEAIQIITSIEQRLVDNSQKYIKDGLIPVDTPPETNLFLKDFFIRGKMAIDLLGNKLGHFLGFNISFFFGEDDTNFERKLDRFTNTLGGYQKTLFEEFVLPRIRQERDLWIHEFCKIRNKIEHHGFQFPYPEITAKSGIIELKYFEIKEGEDIRKSLNLLWAYIFELCEDLLALMLSTKIKEPYVLKMDFREERTVGEPKFSIILNPAMFGASMQKIA